MMSSSWGMTLPMRDGGELKQEDVSNFIEGED
jgi:hypothetical protein